MGTEVFVGGYKIRYWTIGVTGGRWSDPLLIAAENVLHAWLKPVATTEEGD